ncbi:DMT family transporter [Faecalispora anaeroviscerum]|uniref:DMT family transporter n=1 Tax=Faecalispora anaeroviscerum TaxID=2991836 RepID=UPI0024BB8C41|nr:DMT family transporter [Faecalispora anaeroviscerum]
MLFFILLAAVNGFVTVINKMINLEAKKSLGTINGTLINYIEGTLISLVVVLFLGNSRLTDLSHWAAVPPINLLGGVFGLVAMVLTVIVMERVRVSYSTIILLAAQLGTGFVLDAIAAGNVVPLKLLGLIIVIAGIFIDQFANSKEEKSTLREEE